jgi:hypothetical protein
LPNEVYNKHYSKHTLFSKVRGLLLIAIKETIVSYKHEPKEGKTVKENKANK